MESMRSEPKTCAASKQPEGRFQGSHMAGIESVTGTAFIVAEWRAEENAETRPLYRDPIVPLFLTDETNKAAEHIAAGFPPIKKVVKIRTRYFDDRLDQQLQLGYRQVVILGAGLDTRSIRKQAPGVVYFEIDDGNTLSFKKSRLEGHGRLEGVTFIPANYVTDGLVQLLKQYGFDLGIPAHFIWEGNTMYLTAASVRQVLVNISQHVGQFTLSFDYFAPEVIAKATGDPGVTGIVERFAAMGAPWNYGIENIRALADEAGMTVADNIKTAKLHLAYWPSEPLDSPIYDQYFLCTLESPAR
jgi:methyltransferase (TIGR00027 family)